MYVDAEQTMKCDGCHTGYKVRKASLRRGWRKCRECGQDFCPECAPKRLAEEGVCHECLARAGISQVAPDIGR